MIADTFGRGTAGIIKSPLMPHKHASLFLAVALSAACAHQVPQPEPQTNAAPKASATRRYTVLMSTNKAGTQVVSTSGDTVTVDYEFNDRGRGPKTHTVMRLGANDVPLSMETTGNDYYKVAVEERFSTDGAIARWK